MPSSSRLVLRMTLLQADVGIRPYKRIYGLYQFIWYEKHTNDLYGCTNELCTERTK